MIGPRPICYGCKHFQGPWRCAAFPEGIPNEIIDNAVDHRKTYSNDGLKVFAPKDKESSDYAQELFG